MTQKLRIGVIGVSGRGTIARYWQEDERAEVVGGADISEDRLDNFKE